MIATNRTNRRFLYAAVGGVVLLIAAWSSPGLAAAHAAIGCDRVAEELRSLKVNSLTVEVVDLSDVSASPESSDNLTESVAPLLFLTPRVATILQDVFGDSENAKPVGGPAAAGDSPKPQETAASPVVDNVGAERESPLPMYEHAAILPRFQRQMYRTDI